MQTLKDLSAGRENSITFVRLVAAFAVIYGHSHAIAVSNGGGDIITRITGIAHAGGVAVDLFFILSGFLVTASILKRGLWTYCISRVLRLFPALWVYLVLMVFIIGPIISTLSLREYLTHPQTWNYFLHLGTGTQTEWFLPGVFESLRMKGSVNGSIWSVVLELRMYLFVAFAYVVGIFRSRAVFNAISFILVVSVWAGLFTVPGVNGATDLHMGMLFLTGAFLYMNRDLIVVSPLYMVFALVLAGMTHGTDKAIYGYSLVVVGLFLFVCFHKFGQKMDKIGDFSYGVYLWGWPVQQLVASALPSASPALNTIISCVIVLPIGILSWKFVEEPCLKLKDWSLRAAGRNKPATVA